MFIDTHVHLNADQYEDDLQKVINRALDANVKKWWLLDLIVSRLKEP